MTVASLALALASASVSRARLLEAAGLTVLCEPSRIDEDEIKAAFRASGAGAEACATALAEAKALRVSGRRPGVLVIGADQMLVCEGRWFDKPADRREARAHLLSLRGRAHELVTAACVARDGAVLWRVLERPRLVMRRFSDAFAEAYLDAVGDAALASVGAYQLEGRGVQLFAAVEGDFFAILGLPLLPLLDFLRGHGVVSS
jgi:septum formation protein